MVVPIKMATNATTEEEIAYVFRGKEEEEEKT